MSACGSPLGLGTDIGGSARIPAFNCGLFGHKLTTGKENTKFINYFIIRLKLFNLFGIPKILCCLQKLNLNIL